MGSRVALYDAESELRGVIDVEDVFEYDKKKEARNVYRTEDENHPGVAALYGRKDVLVGGPVWVLQGSAILRA